MSSPAAPCAALVALCLTCACAASQAAAVPAPALGPTDAAGLPPPDGPPAADRAGPRGGPAADEHAAPPDRPPARPAPDPVGATPAPRASPRADVGTLLQDGFLRFRDGDNAAAAHRFQGALATGSLNDAGRALAYWHLYLAQAGDAAAGHGIDALASFVTVAEDLVAERDARPGPAGALDAGSDFVVRFDLRRRLVRAHATLTAAWDAVRADARVRAAALATD